MPKTSLLPSRLALILFLSQLAVLLPFFLLGGYLLDQARHRSARQNLDAAALAAESTLRVVQARLVADAAGLALALPQIDPSSAAGARRPRVPEPTWQDWLGQQQARLGGVLLIADTQARGLAQTETALPADLAALAARSVDSGPLTGHVWLGDGALMLIAAAPAGVGPVGVLVGRRVMQEQLLTALPEGVRLALQPLCVDAPHCNGQTPRALAAPLRELRLGWLGPDVVLRAHFVADAYDTQLVSAQRQLLTLMLGALVAVAAVSVLLARGFGAPLHEFRTALRRIEAGHWDEPVRDLRRGDELGALLRQMESMRAAIARRQQEMLRLAYQDGLTGLPNRARFLEQLARVLQRAAKAGQHVAVIVLGLDRFRSINDTLGQEAGDQALVGVAARLRALEDDAIALARLGGDEFVFVLSRHDLDAAQQFARRVLDTLEQPFIVAGQPLDVSASLGLACYPEQAGDAHALLRHADIAMAEAKRRNIGLTVFEPHDDPLRGEHLSLLGELRRAVSQNELRVFYQPKLRIGDEVVIGAEALIRWLHPSRGMVPPGMFIGFAEETGFIRQLTAWMLPRVVADCARWRAGGLALQAAVNLSTRDLLHKDLPGQLRSLLAEHDLPGEALGLEITESALMDDPYFAQTVLHALREIGVGVAIDDFGTGQASLGYLRALPVTELKIDQTFVRGVLEHHTDAAIVRTTIGLAHDLGLTAVAEGVETEAQLARLRALGCDIAQGYHIARPMPAEEFEAWLARHTEAKARAH